MTAPVQAAAAAGAVAKKAPAAKAAAKKAPAKKTPAAGPNTQPVTPAREYRRARAGYRDAGLQRAYGRGRSLRGGVDAGAGFVLGLLVWGWVVLPFLKDGPAGTRKVLMAKFLNRAPDGSLLP